MNLTTKTTLDNLIENFDVAKNEADAPKIKVGTRISHAAFYFEKIRNVIDYQEENLLHKNAIKRILKRELFLYSSEPEKLAERLIRELIWARYLNDNSLPHVSIKEIGEIIKYQLEFKRALKSSYPRAEINRFVLANMACEIEEYLFSHHEEELMVDYIVPLLVKKIKVPLEQLSTKDREIQVEIATRRTLLRSDDDQIKYILFKKFLFGLNLQNRELEVLGQKFDHLYNQIIEVFDHPLEPKINRYVRRNVPPFEIIWDLLRAKELPSYLTIEQYPKIKIKINLACQKRYEQAKVAVVRGMVRGILFIFLTKIVLAFILEVPFDIIFANGINYEALIINVLLPPTLMFLAVETIRVPSEKNTENIQKYIQEIIFETKISSPDLILQKPNLSLLFLVFNFVYTLLMVTILVLVIIGLATLHFNGLSIILFFFFVSLVSFIAFRIRRIAKELEVIEPAEGPIANLMNFFMMPFIRIGRYISTKFSRYNVFLFVMDFLIEAPLKTLIRIFESWMSFVRQKREEIE